MSKQILTVVWCDGPIHLDEQVEAAVTHRITTDSVKETEVDLCDVCDKQLARPLLDLLAEVGQPVRKGQPKSPPRNASERKAAAEARAALLVLCPVEGCDWGPRKLSAAAQHTPRAHEGQLLPALEGRYGRRLADGSRVTLEHICPECGSGFDSGGGLSGHQRRVHAE